MGALADIISPFVAALPVAAAVIDPSGTVLACNAIAERTFGCDGAVTGVPFRELARHIADLNPTIEQAMAGQQTEPLETVDATGAGVLCRVSVLSLGDQRALLVTAEDRADVTALRTQVRLLEEDLRVSRADMDTANAELKTANEELQVTNDQLEARLAELRDALEISRHKDDFLAMLAHELRNPLAPILSAMQVIRRHPDNEDVVQRAREVVERQVRHQARLLDDLLDVSRITRGRITLRKTAVDVRAAVAAAVEATRPMIDGRGHTLSVVVPDTPLSVQADPTRLTQIVTNLLDNAAKYTNPGGQIDVHAERDGNAVVLRVRDTGIGIPPDMQGRIFDLFTQVDAPIARTLGGLGLGLSLVRSLVELHGGSISVASEGRERGTEFTVRLPVGAADAPAGEARATPPAGRHVMVIEDNADARDMLRIALELEGHRVETAADGVTGVETAIRTRPDVILIDLGLPGLDGYAVARRLRVVLGDRVTLVALTGYGQSEDRRRTREAGFDAHLVKPVDPDVLSRALANGFRTAA
ncbi:MAG TPA: ATP-binding protein [Methylomirabilota bacterium]|nr:ATP-binding protein [Methylomirabilota bacterium]